MNSGFGTGGRSRSPDGGFVLIAVLGVLVILSILGATIGVITQRLRDEQFLRQRQLHDEIAMASTRATSCFDRGAAPLGRSPTDKRKRATRATLSPVRHWASPCCRSSSVIRSSKR